MGVCGGVAKERKWNFPNRRCKRELRNHKKKRKKIGGEISREFKPIKGLQPFRQEEKRARERTNPLLARAHAWLLLIPPASSKATASLALDRWERPSRAKKHDVGFEAGQPHCVFSAALFPGSSQWEFAWARAGRWQIPQWRSSQEGSQPIPWRRQRPQKATFH